MTPKTSGLRLSLGDLVGAGGRAVSRYTGTLFAVFLVQSIVAAGCMVAVALVLSNAFGHLPMFDEAVDGDVIALVWSVLHTPPSFLAIAGIVVGVLVVWELVTWFLAGGLYGVLAHRPESRAETARVFGASGAATYLAYARLAVCSLFGWALAFVVFGLCAAWMAPRYLHALTVRDLIVPVLITFGPAGLVLHFFWTVTDYARAELALRHASHGPGAVMTYLRTVAYVVRRPLTLVHGAFGWLAFVAVTLVYAVIAQGHPMYGAEGAVTLFVARQGVALLRMAIRVGVMGGQVELARTRPLPPRRSEPTSEKAEPA